MYNLNELLDNNDYDKILEYAIRNSEDDLDIIGQKKLIKYCSDRGADKSVLEKIISEYLKIGDYRKIEPFMEYANVDTLLIKSVELNWPDGINFAIRNGAKNFEFAAFKAVQAQNYELAEYLQRKK